MAKKGQAIQLQTEVNNDEEWEKILLRDGLIIVDVYSDWCGPCSGMTATLKKLKLEIGGDVLQLAIAKSDKITALARFRNKSEPTWMFISNGKMVNFMFGANAPKLTRLIIDELKKENEAREGRRERVLNEINELSEEEKERLAVTESQQIAAAAKEMEKAYKELRERRLAECQKILETLNHLGVMLIFPHARLSYQEAFGDLLGEAGLIISQTEKVDLNQAILEELFFFGENPFSEEAVEELESNTSIILAAKPMAGRDIESTDDLLLEIIYGHMKKPPGSPDSPAKMLEKFPKKSEEEEVEESHPDSVGIWLPILDLNKATALRLFFHKITEHYEIAEPEPIPPHYAVVFDAIQRQEIADLMEKYPNEILRYGFFTSDLPEEAKLVAKTIKKYEKAPDRAPEQKMVIQLSKKRSECVLAFVQLKPLYVSPNASEGKKECQVFFGDDYDEPPEEEEEEPPPPPPRKKKKKPEPSPDGEEIPQGEGGDEPTGEEPEGGVDEDEEEQKEGEEVAEKSEEPLDGENQPVITADATSEVAFETTTAGLEPVTEPPLEPVTEAPIEPVTEAPIEPVTEAPLEQAVESSAPEPEAAEVITEPNPE